MSSLIDLTGTAGFTTTTFGDEAIHVIGRKSFSGSQGTFSRINGMSQCTEPFNKIVYPSGKAFAAISDANRPLLSTITCCRSLVLRPGVINRAAISSPPPGSDVMIRRGLLG